MAFWEKLSASEQTAFEAAALRAADRTKRDGYRRAEAAGGLLREQYRQLILREQFERQQAERRRIKSDNSPPKSSAM